MLELLADPNVWVAFATLTVMEIVLGIDNVIFISILAGKLPKDQQARARFVGLSLAMITRVLLLLSIAWMARLTNPLFEIAGHPFSGRDLILIGLIGFNITSKIPRAEEAGTGHGADQEARNPGAQH